MSKITHDASGPHAKSPPQARLPIVLEILALAEKSGWTDWQICQAAGVNDSYLSALRRGFKHNPGIVELDAVAGVFGLKLMLRGITRGRPKMRKKPLVRRRPARAQGQRYAGKP